MSTWHRGTPEKDWTNRGEIFKARSVAAKNFGLRKEHGYAAMKYVADGGLRVTKSDFIDLLFEASGQMEVAKGFDVEEAS